MNSELENDINTIKLTDPSVIATILSCSNNQAGKFKRGFSGLSNAQAQKLKEKLDLEPKAFNEIRKKYLIQIKAKEKI